MVFTIGSFNFHRLASNIARAHGRVGELGLGKGSMFGLVWCTFKKRGLAPLLVGRRYFFTRAQCTGPRISHSMDVLKQGERRRLQGKSIIGKVPSNTRVN